jgi:hypothetical protein
LDALINAELGANGCKCASEIFEKVVGSADLKAVFAVTTNVLGIAIQSNSLFWRR